jgi:2-hydroxy-3-oxopropionate reductase
LLASGSDVVITMLPDTPDVEEVALGPGGVLSGIRPGALYLDMSTVSPMLAERISEAGAAKGAAILDAPVSGGEVGAQKATLSIMVGGEEGAFERALPLLQAMGKNIVHCGGPGAGQIVKACNQILVALTIEGVAEALTLGARAGVDPAKIVQVLGAGLARCGILETRGPL